MDDKKERPSVERRRETVEDLKGRYLEHERAKGREPKDSEGEKFAVSIAEEVDREQGW